MIKSSSSSAGSGVVSGVLLQPHQPGPGSVVSWYHNMWTSFHQHYQWSCIQTWGTVLRDTLTGRINIINYLHDLQKPNYNFYWSRSLCFNCCPVKLWQYQSQDYHLCIQSWFNHGLSTRSPADHSSPSSTTVSVMSLSALTRVWWLSSSSTCSSLVPSSSLMWVTSSATSSPGSRTGLTQWRLSSALRTNSMPTRIQPSWRILFKQCTTTRI